MRRILLLLLDQQYVTAYKNRIQCFSNENEDFTLTKMSHKNNLINKVSQSNSHSSMTMKAKSDMSSNSMRFFAEISLIASNFTQLLSVPVYVILCMYGFSVGDDGCVLRPAMMTHV